MSRNNVVQTKSLIAAYISKQGFVHWLLLLGASGGTLLASLWMAVDPDWFGAGRYQTHEIPFGRLMPSPCEEISLLVPKLNLGTSRGNLGTSRNNFGTSRGNLGTSRGNLGTSRGWPVPVPSEEGQATVRHWSKHTFPDWRVHNKVTAPRVLLAKLHENFEVEEVNRYLLAAKPWRGVGSSWAFHYGDHDFSMVTLTTLLYMFGHQPDRLYPETLKHLLENLLVEEGGIPLVMVPRTFGLILDTENHHLMTEGSRYLKNQWLATNGTEAQRADPRYDNRENGLEAWLITYLEVMLREGVYEFNSRPYIGYTMQALLNLEAYPNSSQIRLLARYLLDIINLQYALGSLDLRRYPPFRRQYQQAHRTGMDTDSHTAFMRIWTGSPETPGMETVVPGDYQSFTLIAELLPYRPPEDIRAWTLAKPEHYFVCYGRGATACPELYCGGPGYLLSAGGANRGWRSHIVARPITLMLSDGETDAQRCFHIPGRGPWRTWNTTGVYHCFAVANAPVFVPQQYEALAEAAGWRLFRGATETSPLIAAYSAANLGIIALFPEPADTPESLLAALQECNPDAAALHRRFNQPDGRYLEYDPEAPKGTWVMVSDNGAGCDRNYDAWPQLDGVAPDLSFRR